MRTSTIIGIVIILIIALGAWWFVSTQQPAAVTEQAQTGSAATSTDSGMPDAGVVVGASAGAAPLSATIAFTDSGFSPATVTIAKGGTVTFVDQSARGMWIGSDEHPTHTEYDGTSRSQHCAAGYAGEKPFDQCGVGKSYSFTFGKTGTFDFHNHVAAQYEGAVIVQ